MSYSSDNTSSDTNSGEDIQLTSQYTSSDNQIASTTNSNISVKLSVNTSKDINQDNVIIKDGVNPNTLTIYNKTINSLNTTQNSFIIQTSDVNTSKDILILISENKSIYIIKNAITINNNITSQIRVLSLNNIQLTNLNNTSKDNNSNNSDETEHNSSNNSIINSIFKNTTTNNKDIVNYNRLAIDNNIFVNDESNRVFVYIDKDIIRSLNIKSGNDNNYRSNEKEAKYTSQSVKIVYITIDNNSDEDNLNNISSSLARYGTYSSSFSQNNEPTTLSNSSKHIPNIVTYIITSNAISITYQQYNKFNTTKTSTTGTIPECDVKLYDTVSSGTTQE